MPKQVILFLAANPTGAGEVNLTRECAEIQAEISRTRHRDDFELTSRWAVTVDDVMRDLNECQPAVMHFSGHGNNQHGLLFEDARGGAQPVDPATLAEMVAAAGSNVRLVVLNACYADGQAQALSATVDCVVGMSGQVQDDDARAYSVGFYRALGYRKSIAAAHKQGIATVHARRSTGSTLTGPRDVGSPGRDTTAGFDAVLLSRPGNDPSRMMLTALRPHKLWRLLTAAVVVFGLLGAGTPLLLRDAKTDSTTGARAAGDALAEAMARSVLAPASQWANWGFATASAKVATLLWTLLRPGAPVDGSATSVASVGAAHPYTKKTPCWVTADDLHHPRTGEPSCSHCTPAGSTESEYSISLNETVNGKKIFDRCLAVCVCQ